MRQLWQVGSLSVVGHGALMLCLGITLSTIGSTLTTPMHGDLGYALAAVLTLLCLLIAGMYLAVLELGARVRRSPTISLLVVAFSLACWLAFWMIRSAFAELPLLALFAGIHGIFWGLWYLRLAFRFQSYPRKSVVLCVLAAITSCIGIIIATQSGLSRPSALTAVACYTTFIGLQILLTAVFLHRECEEESEFAGWQVREVAMDSTPLEAQRHSYTTPAGDD